MSTAFPQTYGRILTVILHINNVPCYEQKVKLAHELGFNFVRHHSGIGVGPEYFDAADE